jgi:hypothetical protein
METDLYKGYAIYGHSIHAGRVVGTSGVLEFFQTEEEAMAAGIAWAREWVDTNG